MENTGDDATLVAPRLPRPRLRSRLWRWVPAVAAVALLIAWVSWYVSTPESLPSDDIEVTASGIVGKPLYVGMFVAPAGFDRAIHMSGVKVDVRASSKLKITPLLCRHGSFQVTTDTQQFCPSLDDPAGQRLSAGDSIVLKIESPSSVIADISRIRIGFQEGLRWGTEPAGHAGAEVSLVNHTQQ
ncbi:hypothetical protein [Nocardioides montaniterrae]